MRSGEVNWEGVYKKVIEIERGENLLLLITSRKDDILYNSPTLFLPLTLLGISLLVFSMIGLLSPYQRLATLLIARKG